MFKNEKNKTLPKVETYIAQDTLITGTIESKNGTLRIDGEVHGDLIKSHGIIVGEKGKIKSNLEANLIIIAGEISGNVLAFEKVEVLSSARLYGDLESPIISLAEGSMFQGTSKMSQPIKDTNKNIKDIKNK
jgi:cytoskeletal protein CcmA (bactofilin family)